MWVSNQPSKLGRVEIWKDILNKPGYKISNLGRVKSKTRIVVSSYRTRIQKGRILKQWKSRCGYFYVQLQVNKKGKHEQVHRLVAIAFVPNPLNKSQVNHKDSNKTNNRHTNLEWATHQENMDHGKLHKRFVEGINHPLVKLTNEQVKEIRKLYVRRSKIYGSVALGRRFNVTYVTVLSAVYGNTWKHVK